MRITNFPECFLNTATCNSLVLSSVNSLKMPQHETHHSLSIPVSLCSIFILHECLSVPVIPCVVHLYTARMPVCSFVSHVFLSLYCMNAQKVYSSPDKSSPLLKPHTAHFSFQLSPPLHIKTYLIF